MTRGNRWDKNNILNNTLNNRLSNLGNSLTVFWYIFEPIYQNLSTYLLTHLTVKKYYCILIVSPVLPRFANPVALAIALALAIFVQALRSISKLLAVHRTWASCNYCSINKGPSYCLQKFQTCLSMISDIFVSPLY